MSVARMGSRASNEPRKSIHSMGPSIARRDTSQMFPHNKLGWAQMVVKIEWGVAFLEKVRGNAVKTPRAELDLAEYFDTARVWLEQVLQKKDKSQLRSIFEGASIKLLVHLESLCERVELKVSSDKRRLDLLERCKAVDEVLADLGYADQMRQAVLAEQCVLEEETHDPVDEVVPHLTDAAFLGAQAIAQEQVGDFQGAVDTYEKATCSLRTAIAVCRAVAKFKASIGSRTTQALQDDMEQLQRLERQTSIRIEHLKILEPDVPPMPVETQIQPVELSMHNNFNLQKRMMHTYAGLGIVGGAALGGILFMSGPFGLALLAGTAVAGAIFAAVQPEDGWLKQILADMAALVEKGLMKISKAIEKEILKLSADDSKVVVDHLVSEAVLERSETQKALPALADMGEEALPEWVEVRTASPVELEIAMPEGLEMKKAVPEALETQKALPELLGMQTQKALAERAETREF